MPAAGSSGNGARSASMGAREMPKRLIPQSLEKEWLAHVTVSRDVHKLRYGGLACVPHRGLGRAIEEASGGRIRAAGSVAEVRRIVSEIDVLTALIALGDLDELTSVELMALMERRWARVPTLAADRFRAPGPFVDRDAVTIAELRFVKTASFVHEEEVVPLALAHEDRGRPRRELERAIGLALAEEGGLTGLSELYLVLFSHDVWLPAAAKMAKHELSTHTYRLLSGTILPRLGLRSFDCLTTRQTRMQRTYTAPPCAERAGVR